MITMLWEKSKATDAQLVVCQTCDWHGDMTHPYWGLRQLKGLHERSGHTVIYGRYIFNEGKDNG